MSACLPSLQKYIPRRPRSRWSQVNVAKVEALTAAGRMRPPGLAEVAAAQADGRWAAAYASQRDATVPPDLAAALEASPQAARALAAHNKTERYGVILKLLTARSAAARETQLQRAIAALSAPAATSEHAEDEQQQERPDERHENRPHAAEPVGEAHEHRGTSLAGSRDRRHAIVHAPA